MLHYPNDYDVTWTGYEELMPPRPSHSIMEQYNRVYSLDRYECQELRKLSSQDLSTPKKFKLIVVRPRRKQHYVRSNH